MKCSLYLLVAVLSYCSAHADEVSLSNGDRLSGTVLAVADGSLTIRTELEGKVVVSVADIERITTDEPVTVLTVGGEILIGRVEPLGDGRFLLLPGGGRENLIALGWVGVEAINPPQTEWEGTIKIGAGVSTGNTDRSTISAGFDVGWATDEDELRARADFNYAEEDDAMTARNTFALFRYQYSFAAVLYGYTSVELLSDEFRDLNLRTVVGPGLGIMAIKSDRVRLTFDLGGAIFSEDLAEGEDDQWFTPRAAASVKWNLPLGFTFSEHVVVFPDIENEAYQLRNEASLDAAFGSGWGTRVTGTIEHDSDPPAGVDKTDVYWDFGLTHSL